MRTERRAFSDPESAASNGKWVNFSTFRESTKGTISRIYLEPIDLGWHFQHLNAVVSFGVIMPSGGYNPEAKLNTGPGNAAGLFGLGTVVYPDAERSWSLSIYTHYVLYARTPIGAGRSWHNLHQSAIYRNAFPCQIRSRDRSDCGSTQDRPLTSTEEFHE